MYCICCKKNNVTPYPTPPKHDSQDTVTEEGMLWKSEKRKDGSESTIDNEMISNGIIQIISAGYGSTHDGDKLIIAICDDCIDKNLQDATLLYFDDYLFHDKKWINDEYIEPSKKAYRRRKNLDDLV